MRSPSTAVRGVFVIIIILGVVLISNMAVVQSGLSQQVAPGSGMENRVRLDVPTPSPTPTETPNLPIYFPVIKNNYGFLYSSVVIANGQGFDNCKPLSVDGMQKWWDSSPYSTVNIYLGGISALCPFNQLDFEWYSQVAKQGWSFILTWAGPQSPHGCPKDCKFRYPMSTEPEITYLEGRLEALYAVEAAQELGFKGQLVIYYDVESYSGADEETREAVAEFIRGWTEQLHELGHIAGAYGAACTSYVVDWAFNDPPLDEVWIAKWNKEYVYDPDASVYNTICLDTDGQPPIFWVNHQRIKQYTGPHDENWGGLTVKIDSNVLDGKVNALFGHPPEKNFQPSSAIQNAPQPHLATADLLRNMQLISPATGWVLRENQLLWTTNAGHSWQEITPLEPGEILDVHFNDPRQGWLVSRQPLGAGTASLEFFRTTDGGQHWSTVTFDGFTPAETLEIASASFEFLDEHIGWLVLKLHSGINFSFGRLLATIDGGTTWQERELPLGEAVVFRDEFHGWTAGGPLDQVYLTEDGGLSWVLSGNTASAEQMSLLAGEKLHLAGEPPQDTLILELVGEQNGWALVQEASCTGFKPRPGESIPPGAEPLHCTSLNHLLSTADGGASWTDITPTD
jgi:hypothetical protein